MGIKFFRKNRLDLSNELPTITVTDAVATDNGQDYVQLLRNRNNNSGWATTNSSDAANTTIEVDFIDTVNIDSIILIGHNFKAYTIQYWNGSSWVNFSTAINVTNYALSGSLHQFASVATQKVKIIITAAQTLNADKVMKQLIICESLGEFSEEPEVIPQFSKERRVTKYISGKSFVSKSVGAFNLTIKKDAVASSADLSLVELLFEAYEGFLVYICGGTVTQFEQIRQGYRLEDIYFMNCSNELETPFVQSRWKHGMSINLKLVEVN